MDITEIWAEKLSHIDCSNQYIKQTIKVGRELRGAVYNFFDQEQLMTALVADKSGSLEVSIQESGVCSCTCSSDSFCEHITAVLFYAESLYHPGKMSQLFQMWREMERKKGASTSHITLGNPLYTERIKHMKSAVISLERSKQIKCNLRPYQQYGVKWLVNLYQNQLGSLLADDMGLGKTIQAITFLNEVNSLAEMSLIVVPTSLLANWEKEFEAIAPHLKLLTHYGNDRESKSFEGYRERYDAVVTTYTTITNDAALFKSTKWNIICLDEAQHIKNADTKRSKVIRSITCNSRLALSGTPIQNRLMELWAIIEFLNPRFLGTKQVFKQLFVIPIEQKKDVDKRSQLQQLVNPFILRRTKMDKAIINDLPAKIEQKQYCTLTDEQQNLYQAIIKEVKEKSKKLTKKKRTPYIMMMMEKLKQLCDHPSLYLKEEGLKEFAERSNKVTLVEELIDSIVESNESVLLFTQYVQMGEWLKTHLIERYNSEILFLNGSSSQEARREMVDKFQTEQVRIFILSLHAGGTGLNLTAANHVIHYDRWWNPAVENQATDRVHRIGQKKIVQVHKLITLGTLEEKVDHILSDKQHLSDSLFSANSFLSEDIEELL
ncbi:SNF2-related protein [Paenibacillus sp. GCM10027626]|uniref:DEAD/DEAH box helicase n=1 Tax=Paenibacillus sp. GCM10027626 TaxID=3273411 RepID=UPI00363BA093